MKIYQCHWLSELALESLQREMTEQDIGLYYKKYLDRQYDHSQWKFEGIRHNQDQRSYELRYSQEIPDDEYMWRQLGGTKW